MALGSAKERGQPVKALWLNDGQNLFRDEDWGRMFDRTEGFWRVLGSVGTSQDDWTLGKLREVRPRLTLENCIFGGGQGGTGPLRFQAIVRLGSTFLFSTFPIF